MSDMEKLANWMMANGFATGHGDNMDELLKELTWQVDELRASVISVCPVCAHSECQCDDRNASDGSMMR